MARRQALCQRLKLLHCHGCYTSGAGEVGMSQALLCRWPLRRVQAQHCLEKIKGVRVDLLAPARPPEVLFQGHLLHVLRQVSIAASTRHSLSMASLRSHSHSALKVTTGIVHEMDENARSTLFEVLCSCVHKPLRPLAFDCLTPVWQA